MNNLPDMSGGLAWVKDRLTELSSLDGVLIAGAAAAVLLGQIDMVAWLAWPALAWGIYRIVKAEK